MTKQSDAIKAAPINTSPAGTVRPAMWNKAAYLAGVAKAHAVMGEAQVIVTETAIQALLHLEAHKDVATLNRFIVGFPKGFRRNAMAAWCLAYGCVKVNQDKGTAKTTPLEYDKNKVCKVEAGMADPWFGFMPEKPIATVFDLQRAIHMVLQNAKGKAIMVNGKPLDPTVATGMLKTMAAMVGEAYDAEPTAVAAPEPEAPEEQTRRVGDVEPEAPKVVAEKVKPAAKKVTAKA